jgi:hypothetical protein
MYQSSFVLLFLTLQPDRSMDKTSSQCSSTTSKKTHPPSSTSPTLPCVSRPSLQGKKKHDPSLLAKPLHLRPGKGGAMWGSCRLGGGGAVGRSSGRTRGRRGGGPVRGRTERSVGTGRRRKIKKKRRLTNRIAWKD